MKIGLYFGSFNPIHIGHLIVANHMAEYSDLDQIWFVLSPHNPLKNKAGLLNEYDRLFLVQVAIENNLKFKTCDIEFKLPRPSYTIDTLTYLNEKHPQHEFYVIMGSDSLKNISNWKNSQFLLTNFSFYVYTRPGFEIREPTLPNVFILQAPLLEISSTYIRSAIQAGKSVKYLVPDKVLEEIERNRYYAK